MFSFCRLTVYVNFRLTVFSTIIFLSFWAAFFSLPDSIFVIPDFGGSKRCKIVIETVLIFLYAELTSNASTTDG